MLLTTTAPVPNVMDVFSKSRIASFLECPRKAANKYVFGIPEPDTEPTVLGKAVHEVIRLAGEYLAEFGKLPKAGQVKEWVDAEKAKAGATGLLTNTALDDISKFARRAIKLMGEAEIPAGSTLLVEHHFQVEVPGVPGAWFQGFIDFGWITPDGKAAVFHDWKTSRKSYEVDADPGKQLPLYAWAMKQDFPGIESITLRLDFIRLQARSERITTDEMLADAVTYLAASVQEILSMVAASNFPATPGASCEGCQVLNCPKATAEVTPLDLDPSLMDEEMAKYLFGIFLATENRAESIKESLRKYIEAHGAVGVNGKFLGFYGKAALIFPDGELVKEVIKKMDLAWEPFFKPDEAKLRKLMETRPEIEQAGEWKKNGLQFKVGNTHPDEANEF